MFKSLPVPWSAWAAAVASRTARGLAAPGSHYGNRPDPFDTSKVNFHAGLDVAVPTGTDLLAVDDGIVVEARRSDSAGNLVRYDLTGRLRGRVSVMHLDSYSVVVGQRLKAGQLMGKTGETGRIKGAHLHIEWKPEGASGAVDPLPLMPQRPPTASAAGLLFGVAAVAGAAWGVRWWMGRRGSRGSA